jgi:enoyl-CoA hydratase/carnithine racemase
MTMSDAVVLLAKADRIATITLNRPEKANTLRMEVVTSSIVRSPTPTATTPSR